MDTIMENLRYISKDDFALLIDSMEEAVLLLNKENIIVGANKAAGKLLGGPKDILKRKFSELFEHNSADYFEILRERKNVVNYTVEIKNHLEEKLVLNSNILFLDNDLGSEGMNIVVILKDTVNIQEMEKYVKHVDKLAMIGQLSAGIAHEIRNPLAGISTTAQVLRGKLDDSQREFIDVILNEISRLDNIVRELLDFARPVKTYLQSCNVNEIIEKVLVLVTAQFRKIKIKIERDYLKSEASIITADSEQLMQAFLNIILNAVAAMPEGGKLLIKTILVKNNTLQIQFSDTGCGIAKEKIENLFKPFFTTKVQGMGLGLTVTKRIIEQHKGMIKVESQEGAGTTFFVELPTG